MQQGRRQALGGHQRRAEDDVGQVRHGGPGQTALPVGLLHRPGRAVEDGEGGEAQHHRLGPGTLEELDAVGVPGEADDGEHAGFDHRHRVQQGRHGSGSHRGHGQPAAGGEHGSLDAEAEHAQGVEDQGELGPGIGIGVQQPPEGEVLAVAVGDQEDHRGKGEGRAAQGVDKVGSGCFHCLPGVGVEHQRHRGQGQQLIEAVHGEQIAGHRHAQGHAVGHGEEGEKELFAAVVAHVLKGIEQGQGPEGRDDAGEKAPEPVKAQHQHQIVGEAQQGEALLARAQDQRPGDGRGRQRRRHQVDAVAPLPPQGEEALARARQDGQQDRGKQKDFVHICPRISQTGRPRWR